MDREQIFDKIKTINEEIYIHEKALKNFLENIAICEKAILSLQKERHFLIQKVLQSLNTKE